MPKEGSADDGLIASFSKVGLNWSFHALLIDCCHRLRNEKSEINTKNKKRSRKFKGMLASLEVAKAKSKFIIIVFIFG
jgi:hypothetical protein